MWRGTDVAPRTGYYASLCTGGGGLDLALRLALPDARCVLYVENEISAAGLLAARIADDALDDAPIWSDLRTLDVEAWRGIVDGVVGGFPCPPYSVAGKQAGADDPRDLWPECERFVREAGPRWAFFENVGGSLRDYHRRFGPDLTCAGYRHTASLFTAAEVGAPHQRERLFILAYRRREEPLGNPDKPRSQGRRESEREGQHELPAWPPGPTDTDAWAAILRERPDLAPAVEPAVRGVADGLADGLDLSRSEQLQILGNGVVPLVAAYALRTLAADLGVEL